VSSWGLAVGSFWVLGRDEDFDYAAQESALYERMERMDLRGGALTLSPQRENRLYLSHLALGATSEIYGGAHGAANDPLMIVNIDYLPQFISPLE